MSFFHVSKEEKMWVSDVEILITEEWNQPVSFSIRDKDGQGEAADTEEKKKRR